LRPFDLKAELSAFLMFSGVMPFPLNLEVDLLAVLGVEVDWLVESNRGVFSDLAKLVVERFDRGVPVLVELAEVTSAGIDSREVLLSKLLFRPGVGGPGFM